MKMSFKEKRLLRRILKRINQKSYVGILVVHYSEAKRDKRGICSCSLLVDSISSKECKINKPCQWGLLKLFK